MGLKHSVVSLFIPTTIIFGVILPLTYFVSATSKYKDANPFHWPAHTAAYERAFTLSDSNRDGRMSLSEIEEMYKRAGLEIEGLPVYGIRNGTNVSLSVLTRSQLEQVIDSYSSEGR